MRPISIINFERCYLGAVAIGLANSLLAVPSMLHNPKLAPVTAQFGSGFIYGSMAVGVIIPLLLWFFTARQASVIAKWIITVFFVVGVLTTLGGVVRGFPSALAGVLSITELVLQGVAVYLLFRPDAKAWFADGRGDNSDTYA